MVGGSGPHKRFNPTLVRLRHHDDVVTSGRNRGFNPTLVRLRHTGVVRGIAYSIEFQSHAGSIEAAAAASSH